MQSLEHASSVAIAPCPAPFEQTQVSHAFVVDTAKTIFGDKDANMITKTIKIVIKRFIISHEVITT